MPRGTGIATVRGASSGRDAMLCKIGALVVKGYVLLLTMAVGGLFGANVFGFFALLVTFITSDRTHAPDTTITTWCAHGGWFIGVGVALLGSIMQRRKAAKSRSRHAEQHHTKQGWPAAKGRLESAGEPMGVLSSTFWGGLIGGIGGFVLGMSFLLLFFSITYSPFSPKGWVSSVHVERPETGSTEEGYMMTTNHPVAIYAVFVPPALGVVSGGLACGVTALMGKGPRRIR